MSSPLAFKAIRECLSYAHLDSLIGFYLRRVSDRAGYLEVLGTVAAGELLPGESWGEVSTWTPEQRATVDARVHTWAHKEWRHESEPKRRRVARDAAIRAIEEVYNNAGINIQYASTRQVARSIFAAGLE